MIMHDAATPIIERIEYATDVQIALDFSEVRRALRTHPRQSFTYTLLERINASGVQWWRSRATASTQVPWLPSAICKGQVLPVHLQSEYMIGKAVFIIGRTTIGTTTITSLAGGIPAFADVLQGEFIAPSVLGYVTIGDSTFYGGFVQGVSITVNRSSPTPIDSDSLLNSFTPDGATDITESTVYRESSLDFTGATTPYRDFHSTRPRMVSSYSYLFGRDSDISRFRSFFMHRKGRYDAIIGAKRWTECPDVSVDRRLDQDVLEITHIAHGVARATLVVTDL